MSMSHHMNLEIHLGQETILHKLIIAISMCFGNHSLVGPKYIPLGPIYSLVVRGFTELSAYHQKFKIRSHPTKGQQ